MAGSHTTPMGRVDDALERGNTLIKQIKASEIDRITLLAEHDAELRKAVDSFKAAIHRLESTDSAMVLSAIDVLTLFHADIARDVVVIPLERIAFSSMEPKVRTMAFRTLITHEQYYLDNPTHMKQISLRLAAVVADESQQDDVRLAAYSLICTLFGDSVEHAKAAFAELSINQIDRGLVPAPWE